MVCKKCGANIADIAKFCTECGSKVEMEQPQEQNQAVDINETINESANTVEQDLQKVEEEISENENRTDFVQPNNNESNDKSNKSKTLLYVILGVVLALIAGVLLFLSLNKNENSINALKKAIANFEEKGDDSGTVGLNVEIKSDTSDSMNLSATLKYQEINDEYNVGLTLNKSLLFDEMNLFAKVNEQTATLYTTSDIIDMLGSTQSTEKIWVYYLVNLGQLKIQEKEEDLDLDDVLRVIDKNHFKYIDTNNSIKHYQLIIDNGLIERINSRLDMQMKEKANDILGSTDLSGKSYILDFYINKYNELEKISMNLSEELKDNNVSSAIVSISFNNLGKTVVTIPQQALTSKIDIQTYMQTYSKLNDENNFPVEDDIDVDFNF